MFFNYKNVKNLIFLTVGFLLIIASIIPRGSWSYFNDVEAESFTLGIGICEIEVTPTSYDETNNEIKENDEGLKPTLNPTKDKRIININVKNTGDFTIDHLDFQTVLHEVSVKDSSSYGTYALSSTNGNGTIDSQTKNFAEQFKVRFLDLEGNTLTNKEEWNLYELANPNPENPIDLIPTDGLPTEEDNEFNFEVEISFTGTDQGKSLPVEFSIEGLVGERGIS